MKEVPFICNPKLLNGLPKTSIIYGASCGSGSLALIGIGKIQIQYKDKIYEETIDKTRNIGEIKTFLAPLWGFDSASVVLQDLNSQVLSQQIQLKDLVIEGKTILKMVPKSEVQIGDEEDMKFIFDDCDIPSVKLGSKNQLILWLINPRYSTNEFIETFLITYRMFISPLELIEILIKYFQKTDEIPIKPHTKLLHNYEKKQQQKQKSSSFSSSNKSSFQLYGYDDHEILFKERIIDVFKLWLKNHQCDFFGSKPESVQLLTILHKFIDENVMQYDKEIAFELTRLYHQMDPTKLKRADTLKFAPESFKPIGNTGDPFLNYPLQEIARQLCLISHEMYSNIEIKELIGLGWMKPDKFTRSPNILKMINHANKISNWVCLSILAQSTTKKKIKMYEKFVDLSLECLDLKNYNSLMEIISGLQSNSLLKFAKSWPNFTSQTNPYVDKVEKLSIMLISRNKAELREKLKYSNPPCVPFLGMYLQDLLFLEDGNKDEMDGLINFRKCSLIACTIKSFQKFQKEFYPFLSVLQLKKFLELNDENSIKKDKELAEYSSQLAFLNNTSNILVDRKKTIDLQGERSSMWKQWCDKIDNDKIIYFTDDGLHKNFLEVLLDSFAIENSLYSVMTVFPKNEIEIKLLKRVLEISFIPEMNVDELIEILHLARKINLPKHLRAIFSHSICTFKNIFPHASSYPNISKIYDTGNSDSTSSVKSQDQDDLMSLKGKRKKCNRAAIKLCKVSTTMIAGNDHIQIFPLLYRNLYPNQITDLRNFPITQRQKILDSLHKLKLQQESILPLTGKDNENIRKLEHEKRQFDNSLKEFKKRIDEIDGEFSFIQSEINKIENKTKKYFHDLSSNISQQKSKIERLNAIENLIVHIISLSETKTENQSTNFDSIDSAIGFISNYLKNLENSLLLLGNKLNTILNDIKVMGARYGPAVTKALEFDYSQTQQSFALTIQHFDFANDTLLDLQEETSILAGKNKIIKFILDFSNFFFFPL